MKRPWHYWTVYLAALAVVLTAMTWLTCMTLELDQAEISARQQAELEEDISRALWRMEVKLMPILAREAARPHTVYQPILAGAESGQQAGKGDLPPAKVSLSPLLTDRSELVLLNFEVGPTNQWTSPQSLSGSICTLACDNGASLEEIEACTQRLNALSETVEYQWLFSSLPEDSQLAVNWTGTEFVAQENPDDSPLGNRMEFNTLQQQALENSASNQAGPQQTASNGYFNGNRRGVVRQRNPGNDLQQRAAALRNYGNPAWSDAQLETATANSVREGVSRPVWVGSQLLFARRVETEGVVRIQGCVLNWPEIKRQLLTEVEDLLPGIDIEPVLQIENVNVSRMLAALPAQLVVSAPDLPPMVWSPMRVSLLIVWICLLVAFIGAGVVLHGVLLLSERRGAFVSAVTHELRTPLTTFRMYSEMLARDMVPDPQRRRTYLETLRREADRLSHLVENVLSYARLEKGPSGRGREQCTVGGLLARMDDRLLERAEQAEMKFAMNIESAEREVLVTTDPAAVEQILFNLVDNACKYAVTTDDRRIHLEVSATGSLVRFAVCDQGAGISPRNARKLFRPFSKAAHDAPDSTPGVGLGLALCRRLASELGGRLEFVPRQSPGATFVLELPRDPA